MGGCGIEMDRDSKQFVEMKKGAKDGGDVARATRKDIENKLGKSVVSSDNYLDKAEEQKRIEHKKKGLILPKESDS